MFDAKPEEESETKDHTLYQTAFISSTNDDLTPMIIQQGRQRVHSPERNQTPSPDPEQYNTTPTENNTTYDSTESSLGDINGHFNALTPPNNRNDTQYFPDDPQSLHQMHGPPELANWLPDSGATAHNTPVYSDLSDPAPCNIPIKLADGSFVTARAVGKVFCPFYTDCGTPSGVQLHFVYYTPGLSQRLFSLTAISTAQNFEVGIHNRETTLCFPNNTTFTWPIRGLVRRHSLNLTQNIENNNEEHENNNETKLTTNTRPKDKPSMPLELAQRRMASRGTKKLLAGTHRKTQNRVFKYYFENYQKCQQWYTI